MSTVSMKSGAWAGWEGGCELKISLIVEGKTERVFVSKLREHLQTVLAGRMPALQPVPFDGRIPRGEKLKRLVRRLLQDRPTPSDHVIALTDVYPDYPNAAQAKTMMLQWTGNHERFHPHAAQFEFEAWLLPYWERVQKLAGHNQAAPGGDPELVNNVNPPSRRLKEIFRRGQRRYDYVKSRDAGRILENADLTVAIKRCPELNALMQSILDICDSP